MLSSSRLLNPENCTIRFLLWLIVWFRSAGVRSTNRSLIFFMNFSFRSSSYSRKILGFRLSGSGFKTFFCEGELLLDISASFSTSLSKFGAFLTLGVFKISAKASAVSSEVALFRSLIEMWSELVFIVRVAFFYLSLNSSKESVDFSICKELRLGLRLTALSDSLRISPDPNSQKLQVGSSVGLIDTSYRSSRFLQMLSIRDLLSTILSNSLNLLV